MKDSSYTALRQRILERAAGMGLTVEERKGKISRTNFTVKKNICFR